MIRVLFPSGMIFTCVEFGLFIEITYIKKVSYLQVTCLSILRIIMYFKYCALLTNFMKILIDNGNPIRVYHHPREVVVHPKTNTVEIFNEDGSILESYDLVKKDVVWSDNEDLNTSEIVVTLHVK